MRFVREGIDQDLADAAREFLGRAWSTSTLRETLPSEPLPGALWKQAVELGWTDLLVDEEDDGLGLGAVAAGALMEEAGRALFPGPLLETVLLRGVVGEATPADLSTCATLAAAEPGSNGLPATSVRFEAGGLSGRKTQVPHADVADVLVVVAEEEPGDGPVVVLVDPSAAAITVRRSIDPLHRPCDVVLDRAAGTVVAQGEDAQLMLQRLTDFALALTASRILGVGDRALELSIEYATVREQFGRPIGSFQAVRHRLAEGQMMMTAARSACYLAQVRLESHDPDAGRAARVAKAYLSRVGRRVVEDALQVHGGIGFTLDHDLHLYFQHALTLQGLWGDESVHARALGDALLARATPEA